MSKISRRHILKALGLGSTAVLIYNPYKMVFKALIDGMANKAEANSTGADPKNYLLFLMHGAPPKWMWDNFLMPTNDPAEFLSNKSIQNVIKKNGVYLNYTGDLNDTAYENGQIYNYLNRGQAKQIYMPKLWDAPLPEWNGSQAVYNLANPLLMRDYLQHAMILRGVDMEVDIGHVFGPELVPRPLATSPSLTGLVADASSRLIPAIGVTTRAQPVLGYKAEKTNISLTSGLNSDGPLFDILEPFIVDTSTGGQIVNSHSTNEALMEAAMEEALEELKNYAASRRPGSETLYENLKSSKSLFEAAATDFVDLRGQFTSLRNKYQQVIAACREPIEGILPPPVGTSGHREGLSVHFAVAEFFIKKGYASSFSFEVQAEPSAGNVLTETGGSVNTAVFSDEHTESDRQKSLISNSFTYRSYMACVNAFRQSIGDGLWENTVVQFGSEYGRRPRDVPDANGRYGSDHSPGANSYIALSGSIKQFIPIGNIWRDSALAKTNPGTWGLGSPTQLINVQPGQSQFIRLNKEMAANTIADILGVARPTNAISLIEKDGNGDWVSICEDPVNRDG